LLYQRQKVLCGVIHRVAPEEVCAWTRLGISTAIVAHARTQVKPMVVDNRIHVDWKVESPAQQGRHLDDGITVLGRHVVATPIKIPKVLQANGIGILPIDAGRGTLQRSACHDGAVRKCCEVLSDVRPAIGANVVVSHGLLSFKVVSPVKVRIAGIPSVVLLNVQNSPSYTLLRQPSPKLGKRHFCESMSAFHSVKIKV
jgi:hypothetical protein